ncbi:MAG: PEP-utilizing enzyme [Candidatus Eremiobacteraeota bacterium]|nr:PEP-utilizing enzyme [Candidatus Eremiobacteraeota bacterium]
MDTPMTLESKNLLLKKMQEREHKALSEKSRRRDFVLCSHFSPELPPQLTPLSLYFHNRAYGDDGGITRTYVNTLGIGKPPEGTVLTPICTRTYTDLATLQDLVSFPGLPFSVKLARKALSSGEPFSSEEVRGPTLDLGALFNITEWPLYLFRFFKTRMTLVDLLAEFHHFCQHAFLPSLRDYLEKIESIAPGKLPPERLLEALNSMMDHASCHTMKALETGRFLAHKTATNLARFTARHLNDREGLMAATLMGGTEGNPFLGMEQALWAMGNLARDREKVIKWLRSFPPASSRTRGDSEFNALFQRFLEEYGFMADEPLELAAPAWRSDHLSLVGLILSHAETRVPSPEKLRALDEEKARDLARDICSSLPCPVRKARFLSLLGAARRYRPYRENILFLYLRELGTIRSAVRELGERLGAEKKLKAADDIFYLSWSELPLLVYGTLAGEKAMELAEQRKEEFEAARDLLLPGVIDRYNYTSVGIPSGEQFPLVLKGRPLAGGLARGKGRIIRGPADFRNFSRGEIVIARHIEAPWIPFLANAGGIILQWGQRHSPAVIMAGEMGIPVIGNIPSPQERIPEGSVIAMNGTSGRLYVHSPFSH